MYFELLLNFIVVISSYNSPACWGTVGQSWCGMATRMSSQQLHQTVGDGCYELLRQSRLSQVGISYGFLKMIQVEMNGREHTNEDVG